jgi:hypothetical protein
MLRAQSPSSYWEAMVFADPHTGPSPAQYGFAHNYGRELVHDADDGARTRLGGLTGATTSVSALQALAGCRLKIAAGPYCGGEHEHRLVSRETAASGGRSFTGRDVMGRLGPASLVWHP